MADADVTGAVDATDAAATAATAADPAKADDTGGAVGAPASWHACSKSHASSAAGR